MHTTTRQTLTLTVLALLVLTGCSDQKTGTIPEPTHTTASPSATATTQTSENHSGGSKAPEGEYRPADEHGPAQNVPKPTEPEGMNVETTEGMELFINYWNDLRNYALQTGDVTETQKLVDESFTQEQEFYDSLNKIYDSNGWVIGGTRKIHYDTSLITSLEGGEYSIGANFEVENTVLWVDNEARAYDASDSRYKGVDLRIKYVDGSWKVLSTKVVK